MLADELRHFKHVDCLLAAKYFSEFFIRIDVTLIFCILAFVSFDVGPQFLCHFSARERSSADNGGKFVAGTGTITSEGKVGPIGGITHKMQAAQEAGATLFLVPADNCAEAKSAHDDDLRLVKVDTLTGAVDALKTYSAGGEPPSC